MGVMIRQQISPLGDALLRRDADTKSLGQMICELELELIELMAKLEEDKR